MKSSPNQRDIAKAAGVSTATVSLALRNHPSIPESTRERVRKVAEELGYIPNPRVAELMTHIRRNHGVDGLQESVAMLWADVEGPKSSARQFEEGARGALVKNGFGLELFYQDRNLSIERLQKVLHNRGIRGLILAPLMKTVGMNLDWDWSQLSVVVAGSADWQPEFNRVRFNHFTEMKMLVQRLVALGKNRIGFVVHEGLDQRSQHSVVGGFWASVSGDIRGEDAVCEHPRNDQKTFINWMKAYKPDALIVGSPEALKWVKTFPSPPPCVLRTLHSSGMSGIRQNYTRLGEVAAEMLMGQLQINQCGIPEDPVQSLLTGTLEVDGF